MHYTELIQNFFITAALAAIAVSLGYLKTMLKRCSVALSQNSSNP